jgi:hypothetical protein
MRVRILVNGHRRFGVTYYLFLQKNVEVRKSVLILISTNVPDYKMSLLCKRLNPHLNHTIRYSLFESLRLLRLQLPVKGLSD